MKIKRNLLTEDRLIGKENDILGIIFNYYTTSSIKTCAYYSKTFILRNKYGFIKKTSFKGSWAKYDFITGNVYSSLGNYGNVLFNSKTPVYKKRMYFQVEN